MLCDSPTRLLAIFTGNLTSQSGAHNTSTTGPLYVFLAQTRQQITANNQRPHNRSTHLQGSHVMVVQRLRQVELIFFGFKARLHAAQGGRSSCQPQNAASRD